jgi:hypothetical protein
MFLRKIFLFFAEVPSNLFSSEIDSSKTYEEVGFKICHIRINHQDAWRTLNIKIWYEINSNAHQEEIFDTLNVKKKCRAIFDRVPKSGRLLGDHE